MTTIQIDDDGIAAYANPRRTGVIVGLSQEVTDDTAQEMLHMLHYRFPGVTFAIMAQAASIAFEWDER